MRRAHWALAGFLASGCDASILIQLAPPDFPTAQSVLIAVNEPGGFSVTAYPITRGELRPIALGPFPPSSIVTMEALGYQAPLEELSLTAGPLTSVPPTSRGAAPSPTAGAFQTRIAGRSVSAWTPEETLSPTLQAFRLPPPTHDCSHFTTRLISLDPDGSTVTFALSLTATLALIGTDLHVYELSPSGAIALDDATAPPHHAAARDATGELWFSGEGGQLWRGSYHSATRTVSTTIASVAPVSPADQVIRRMAVYRDANRIEVYGMIDSGAVLLWDGRSWTDVYDYPPRPPASDWYADVAVVGPSEAIAVSGFGAPIRIEHGVARVEGGLADLSGTAIAAAQIPGVGTLLGTTLGDIVEKSSGEWVDLSSNTRLYLFGFAPYSDGFLWGGAGGAFGQFIPGRGFCAPTAGANESVRLIIPLGDGMAMLGNADSPTTTRIVVATPTH